MRKTAQWAIGLIISAVAFWVAFRGVDLLQLGQALRSANYLYLLPAGLLTLVGLAARAFSWQALLGAHVPFRRVFDATNEGYLLNNLLPFRLGELARAYLISRSQRLPIARVLSSVVLERVIDLCMVVGMLLGFLPLVLGLAWARQAAYLSILISFLAALGLFVAALNRARLLALARGGLARLPWLHAERWLGRLAAFLDGLAALQDPRRFALAVLGSGVAWGVTGLSVWVLLRGFVPDAALEAAFFSLVVSALGAAVPSAPAGLGVWEAAFVIALAAFDITGAPALSFALLFHLLNFGLTGVLGLLALSREGETLAHLAAAAQGLLGGANGRPPAATAEPAASLPSIE